MYSRNSFGSYYPINSLIHRLNPVIKLINFVLAIILICLSTSVYVNSFILMLVIIMILMSYVPILFYLNSIWSLRYCYIIIAFLCLYFEKDLSVCMVYMMKFTVVIEYLNLLAYTTSPSENIYGIEKILSFFNFLYLPISKLAFRINYILRFIPLAQEIEFKTFKAASSRGIDYNHSNIFGRMYAMLKVHSNIRRLIKNKNKEIRECSELRLFDIKKYRTNYRTNKVNYNDIFFLLFHIGLIVVHLIESGKI